MKNLAIILAGGTGERINLDVPKQYYKVKGTPIICYTLVKFERNKYIDGILVVADEMWHETILKIIDKMPSQKFIGFAMPGETRQLSILNALSYIEQEIKDTENVIIHDSVRPLVSDVLISECVNGLKNYDAVMPVLRLKDTCYLSEDGDNVSGLIDRNKLFAGQAPEGFKFKKYLDANKKMNPDVLLQINGSSEVAFKSGMKVKMIEGEEGNFKITTKNDLDKFENYMEGLE